MEQGATGVYIFATHGLFSAGALERFAKADLSGIVVTDTVPIDPRGRPDKMTVHVTRAGFPTFACEAFAVALWPQWSRQSAASHAARSHNVSRSKILWL